MHQWLNNSIAWKVHKKPKLSVWLCTLIKVSANKNQNENCIPSMDLLMKYANGFRVATIFFPYTVVDCLHIISHEYRKLLAWNVCFDQIFNCTSLQNKKANYKLRRNVFQIKNRLKLRCANCNVSPQPGKRKQSCHYFRSHCLNIHTVVVGDVVRTSSGFII